jgi:hypothetical protein
MSQDDVTKQINEVIKRYRSVVDYLQKQETIPSFRTLFQTTPVVREAFARAISVRENSRVDQWCNGRNQMRLDSQAAAEVIQ